MGLFKIKSKWDGKVLFELKTSSLKQCIEAAVNNGADLRCADLQCADLWGTNLQGANLRSANLRCADLRCADLRCADLWGANLQGADLRSTNLQGADLRSANLRCADLRCANLRCADLQDVKLYGANLRCADLQDVKLHGANLQGFTWASCPPSGSFVGWKKSGDNKIIKLKIPSWARRVTAIGSRKNRSEFAIVLDVYDSDGKKVNFARGWHDKSFKYQVGKTVKPDWYDASITTECSHGIHFFLTYKEAMKWV